MRYKIPELYYINQKRKSTKLVIITINIIRNMKKSKTKNKDLSSRREISKDSSNIQTTTNRKILKTYQFKRKAFIRKIKKNKIYTKQN